MLFKAVKIYASDDGCSLLLFLKIIKYKISISIYTKGGEAIYNDIVILCFAMRTRRCFWRNVKAGKNKWRIMPGGKL